MNEKRRLYLRCILLLLVFCALYVYLPAGPLRQALIYFLVLVGLYFSAELTEVIVITNGLGLLLLLLTDPRQWYVPTSGLVVLLITTPLLPVYYSSIGRKDREAYRDRHFAMQDEEQKLMDHLAELTLKRHNLENEIDRINQLYILGRELVEHLEIDEVVENMQRILSDNPGIRGACIFSFDKEGWKPLYVPLHQDLAQWISYVRDQKALQETKMFQILPTPAWLGDDTVIFLPVRLDKDLLAAVFLITEKGYGQHYLDRASIFIPQIALGLKRTRLFLEVQERSRIDGLTGLYLRRYFLERLQTEIQRARRYSTVFSLLLADLDLFKSINDKYGHLAGDKVLRDVARAFSDAVRPGDMVGRYGGEEFIVLMPFATPDDVRQAAEKIRRTIAESRIEVEGKKLSVTVSIGICHYPGDGAGAKELLAAADGALYWVKNHGRNGIKEAGEIKNENRTQKDRPPLPDNAPPPQNG